MSVKIKVKGDQETNEYKDAIVLKEIVENEFRNKSINGEILIISNATLFGQDTKDVDLIVMGKFEKYSMKVKTKAKTPKPKEKELDQEERLLFVNDFCFVIETKRHRAEDIQLEGSTLLVKYKH
jgi:hypothetical protein